MKLFYLSSIDLTFGALALVKITMQDKSNLVEELVNVKFPALPVPVAPVPEEQALEEDTSPEPVQEPEQEAEEVVVIEEFE